MTIGKLFNMITLEKAIELSERGTPVYLDEDDFKKMEYEILPRFLKEKFNIVSVNVSSIDETEEILFRGTYFRKIN